MDGIEIRGASTHNLKSINLCLPRNRLIVITGVSGSGKSSLAFDTLYAEGQRRYVESLSSYARQFLSLMDKPEVDYIGGLSPAIAIEQKSTSHNPRSTVGTTTEIYDYLRLLFARAGQPHCPVHAHPLDAQSISQMISQVLSLPVDTKIMVLAPVVRARKGEHSALFSKLQSQGFVRVRIDGTLYPIDAIPAINARQTHNIDVVVDRLSVHPDIQGRLADSLETTLHLSDGLVNIVSIDADPAINWTFSARYACPSCGYSLSELEPRLFSFNHPSGACPTCDGLGVKESFAPERIVPDPTMTLAAGALLGWNRRHPYYFEQLESLAAHYGFVLDTPFGELPEKIQHLLLYGSQGEKISFHHKNAKGVIQHRSQPFEGVIGHMVRRYHEATAGEVQEELARFLVEAPCPTCQGDRLCQAARHVYVADRSLPELTRLSIQEAYQFFGKLQLPGRRGQIAEKIVREVIQRLEFLNNIGLSYLTLHRNASTLSGGESQRIRLASQLGAGLVGVLYVLDEPSIGLHQRDNARLLETLKQLRDLGNTVVVVEHDQEAIEAADYVVDMGPGAGVAGGHITAQGTPEQIKTMDASLTGRYLSGKECIPLPEKRLIPSDRWLCVHEAKGHNLQNVTARFPVGLLCCVTGVSGSGKSTLVNHTLYPHAAHHLNLAGLGSAAPCGEITGLTHFDKVIGIDQSPIGRTPRSNAATYTGLLTPIRELFANTAEARIRGYKPGRFSFNVNGGRCNACEGEGLTKVEMHFLSDLYIPCDVCHGQRYNQQTLQILYKGKNIADILNMTITDAAVFFEALPAISQKLQTLITVGLGYLTLGQSATTLSGGEAQRVKIAKELSRRDTGRTLYILDEPTTGLHFHDVAQLLRVLHTLRNRGNTLIIIEHHLEVIKTADWVIDLGPEGGSGGGYIIAEGPPEVIANTPASYTGKFLGPLLG